MAMISSGSVVNDALRLRGKGKSFHAREYIPTLNS